MTWAIVTKTWRDHWKGTLSWALGLFAITVLELSVYPTVKKSSAGMSQLIDSMPESLKTVFRMTDYTSGTGFLAAELFSFMLPLIFIAIGANAGARATAEEESTGTADLLLALPISRMKILLSKAFASLAVLVVVAALLWVTLVVGSDLANLSVPTSGLTGASIGVGLLGALFTGVGLLAGALTGRKGIALGTSIALALAAFLLYSLAPLMKSLEHWLPINPFQWALGNDPVRNGIDGGYVIALLITTVVLVASAAIAFNRRDISS